MKEYYVTNTDPGCPNHTIIMGSAREIKSLERKLPEKTKYIPLFTDAPKFNMERFYGIYFNDDDRFYTIINEHTCLQILMEETWEEV